MPQPSPNPKNSVLDNLFILRDWVEEENKKVAGLVMYRLVDGENAEWLTGFLDRGQRLLELIDVVLYESRK